MSDCCCCPRAPRLVTEVVDPTLDPRGCNTLSQSDAGLLAPRTQVQGFAGPAPGRVSADFPSVLTTVTPPAVGACPENWQVRGFQTPPRGAVTSAEVNLVGTRPNSTWANTSMVVRLPQPGVYLVLADMDTQICYSIPNNGNNVRVTNLWTVGRLINASAGTPLINGRGLAQSQFSVSPGTAFQNCTSGLISMHGLVGVPAAQGSMAIRVQAGLRGSIQGGAQIQRSTARPGGRLTWVKVGD